MTITLAIDFGSKNIGMALVRNAKDGTNTPLFVGVLRYDSSLINQKVEPRAEIRRVRRTRKAKKTRLRRLHETLAAMGLHSEQIKPIIRFCARRGYKSLWSDSDKSTHECQPGLYHYPREAFFAALRAELESRLSESDAQRSLQVCEQVLNRAGDRRLEVRSVRIENRRVTRCGWDGCERVTPRRAKALRDLIAQLVYAAFKKRVDGSPHLRKAVDAVVDRITDLGKRYYSAAGSDPVAERKILMKRVTSELTDLKSLLHSAASAGNGNTARSWELIKVTVKALIRRQEGRNQFCRDHHLKYLNYLMEDKKIPFKQTISERDLASRRQEILFQKVWRYIEARLLPLAARGIDRVIVERPGFDLLSGTQKQRQKLNEKELEDRYRQGPRIGFASDLDMLKEEFAGLCAYCGKPAGWLIAREHILPAQDFCFNSYLNLLPACKTCNSRHNKAAGSLRIHDEAYDAFSTYFRTRFKTKPPHVYHRIKKGILNLMRQSERHWRAADYIALIGNQLTDHPSAQRKPLILARYLAAKIRGAQALPAMIEFRSVRDAELWRRAAYPKFDIEAQGAVPLIRALNALLFASELPAVAVLRDRHFLTGTWKKWQAEVAFRAPKPAPSGIPNLKLPFKPTAGFEEVLAGNYVALDLSLLNWNRRDTATHKQDPYGWCIPKNCPSKRKKASELTERLMAIDRGWYTPERKREEVIKLINQIAHPNLRAHLITAANSETPGNAAADALVQWLRGSVKSSLFHSEMGNHPADRARHHELSIFCEGGPLLPIIGVRKLSPMRTGNVDLGRAESNNNGNIAHWYQTDPANIGYILTYTAEQGIVDRKKPIAIEIRQNNALWVHFGKEHFPNNSDGCLRKGRVLGQSAEMRDVAVETGVLPEPIETLLRENGMVEYGILTHGCVVKYLDNQERFIRNFSGNYGFRKETLKNVVALKRTPFVQKFKNLLLL
jgi:hypothetical protein